MPCAEAPRTPTKANRYKPSPLFIKSNTYSEGIEPETPRRSVRIDQYKPYRPPELETTATKGSIKAKGVQPEIQRKPVRIEQHRSSRSFNPSPTTAEKKYTLQDFKSEGSRALDNDVFETCEALQVSVTTARAREVSILPRLTSLLQKGKAKLTTSKGVAFLIPQDKSIRGKRREKSSKIQDRPPTPFYNRDGNDTDSLAIPVPISSLTLLESSLHRTSTEDAESSIAKLLSAANPVLMPLTVLGDVHVHMQAASDTKESAVPDATRPDQKGGLRRRGKATRK